MNDQIVVWETMSCLTVPYKLDWREYYTIEMYSIEQFRKFLTVYLWWLTVVCTFKSNLHVTQLTFVHKFPSYLIRQLAQRIVLPDSIQFIQQHNNCTYASKLFFSRASKTKAEHLVVHQSPLVHNNASYTKLKQGFYILPKPR